jgi:hypothetical protein
VLRRLAVFAGGWSLEAAEAVCVTDAFETSELLSALSHLVEASLVVSGEQDGRSRYRLLESVRQYAREILGDSGELRAVQRAHASFFLTFAEKLHLDRREGGPHRLTAGRTLGGERDNLRAALRWCIDSHEVEFAQRLVAVYSGFWIGPTEERGRLNEVLAMDGGDATSNARATALARSAIVARNQGDLERAVEEYLAAANRPQERQYLPHPQLSQWAGRDRGLARTVRASRSAPRGEPGSCPVRRVATDRGDRARLPRLAGMRARDLRYRETVRSRRSRARARYSPMHGRSR